MNCVRGGCRREVDGTTGLPSASEMPCALRQLRFVPKADLMLAVQLVRRKAAIAYLLVALVLFEIRDQGAQPSIRGIKSGQLSGVPKRRGKIPRVARDRDQRH